ncbi:ethanolamine ammonia-lyase subunit EutC [Desulfosarcina sp.]|uniref:ethanolamine ammonia-lyase subunit EutC n=1 Tax=Desulfosarcina sp. TaxID=2027861 RepID=UPI0029A8C600|nr:ethanolamine ammonia-lyase subunit EutC [Desulfosarcina sp.]MDX2452998.1 ethanolamine ammonia-lyase subunit EutC [Desulfosarcina sp.]MDX2490733.1 ethanolamine ammonia-lyase subunit EutC [Desulfosarcina sp.]
MQEPDIQTIVQAVLAEIQNATGASGDADRPTGATDSDGPQIDLDDPTLPAARQRPGIERPINPDGLRALMAATPARIGVGRSGPRPRTAANLLFLADHGVTQDALMHEVDADLLEELGLFSVESMAADRQTYLKRPDLGRKLTEAAKAVLRDRCTKNPDVQVFVGDGLSGAAIDHNLRQIMPVLQQGLNSAGLSLGTPFFVKNARVGLLNDVNDIVDAKVCAILIGERPGLARAQSMSIYLGFRPRPDSTDANRDAICNIYEGGLNPLEAGAHAVQLIQKMIRDRASGVELKLV